MEWFENTPKTQHVRCCRHLSPHQMRFSEPKQILKKQRVQAVNNPPIVRKSNIKREMNLQNENQSSLSFQIETKLEELKKSHCKTTQKLAQLNHDKLEYLESTQSNQKLQNQLIATQSCIDLKLTALNSDIQKSRLQSTSNQGDVQKQCRQQQFAKLIESTDLQISDCTEFNYLNSTLQEGILNQLQRICVFNYEPIIEQLLYGPYNQKVCREKFKKTKFGRGLLQLEYSGKIQELKQIFLHMTLQDQRIRCIVDGMVYLQCFND